MAFHFKWKHVSSSVDGEYVIKLIRYDTLDEILEKHYGCSIADLKKSRHFGFDGNNMEWEFTFEEMYENIQIMGCYGMAVNKEEIHFWVDVNGVDPSDFIGMIAHEKGHLTRPFKRDPMKEEFKAERYGDAASFAFCIAKEIELF